MPLSELAKYSMTRSIARSLRQLSFLLYSRSMIDDCVAAIQLLGNWLAQFINYFLYYVYWVNSSTTISGLATLPNNYQVKLSMAN